MSLNELRRLTEKLITRMTCDSGLVLVAEDCPSDVKVLTDILEAHGYCILTAETGTKILEVLETIKRLEETAPCAALLDYKLSDMNGLELAQRIRELSPSTCCIILTGYATLESAISAVNLRLGGYLVKPYSPDKLLSLLTRCGKRGWNVT